ncbi:MAG: TlpA disulfide reductase family protein [Planctomycetota bacterium]
MSFLSQSFRNTLLQFLPLLMTALFSGVVYAQDEPELEQPAAEQEEESAEEGATIKGKVLQSKYEGFEIDLPTMETAFLSQMVMMPEPPFPPDWAQMNMEQREAWVTEFEKTEEGQALAAEVERIESERKVFQLRIEEDGSFVVYDVPNGIYNLYGRIDKKINERRFAFEIFGGELEVNNEVNEIVLGELQLLVTPLLAAGEMSPNFRVKTWDDSAELVLGHFRGKYTFINFWSLESPPSVDFQARIVEMYDTLRQQGYELELLSINVDSDREKAIEHIKENSVKGRHGFTDGWEHSTLEGFGVRAIPSFWLIDPELKLRLTHADFQQAFFSGMTELSEIVEGGIKGELPPPPVEENEDGETP